MKRLTALDDPPQVVDGVRRAMAGARPSRTVTTLITNAIIERRGVDWP